MLLATRCPHCETVFRLQREQLALHDGLVRCGHCQQVFDAARALVPAEPEAAAAQAAPRTPEQQPALQRLFDATSPDRRPLEAGHRDFTPGAWDMWGPWLDGAVDPKLQMTSASAAAGVAVAAHAGADETPEAQAAATPEADLPTARAREFPLPPRPTLDRDLDRGATAQHEPDPARTFAPLPGDAIEPVLASPAAAALAGIPHDREPHFGSAAPSRADAEPFAAAPETDNREHFAMTRETRTNAARGGFARALGAIVALALAALLAAQLAWWQRETITIYWPSTEPLFKEACATLGCTVTPPRAIDGLRLDASDLRQLDGPRLLELKVPLTNRYRVALAYPSIELTLLDEANNITARRVLAPRDYARPGTRVEAGMPAGATQTMIVRIDTDDIAASNFRVQIFYP
ncbi:MULTISPECIES: DUF3426 domain-containing protein [Burkholderia]|uniref:DUF3426 domain-containing protein n=1 Tax=Burkholderia humptydooensis TaxID=430531 RepID=A0A7U4P1Y8_9BURK|nr:MULTISPECIES: DUF3426 domain-containing protein [Burkholderia]AJY42230.1 family finger-like domain protein [Burkholderia sp. 2002721687]ALX41486.1 thioredoxin [Burkholderia humptydooensis]KVN14386.1 thioredoxin [Burkholderia sp. MSMB1552]KWZ57009.1 thioredoxin [Burkholderia sp. MSMB1588]QPS43351.1 DUF3426 domain-containing protein [Burkholderia humptydooensis]